MPGKEREGIQKVSCISRMFDPIWCQFVCTHQEYVKYHLTISSNSSNTETFNMIKGDKCTMYMRDHPCFCEPCRNRDSEGCKQKHTVGCWKPIKMTKKTNQKVFDSVPSSQREITKFFDGLILQNDRTIIVGLSMTDKENGGKHLKFGTLAVPPRLNTKEALSHEHHFDKLHFDVHVPKGASVVRIKMLLRHPNTTHQFFLPPNSKMVNFPVTDLIYPASLLLSNSSLDRSSHITYTTSETTHTNHKLKTSTQKTYTIDASSMTSLTTLFEM
jgi:hypothetical protein